VVGVLGGDEQGARLLAVDKVMRNDGVMRIRIDVESKMCSVESPFYEWRG
jgi:hypothetical protein